MTVSNLPTRVGLPITGTLFSIIAILITSLASCGEECFDKFALRPGHTLFGDFQPWNVITYLFLEASVFRLMYNVFNFIAFSRRVEAPTGQLKSIVIFKTILKPVLFSAVLMFFIKAYKYTVTFSEKELYSGIYGTSPIIVAYSVLVWQQYGDKPVMTFLPTFCTGNYIPTVVLLSIWILEKATGWSKDFYLSFLTFFVSWIYVRFFADSINQDYIGSGRFIGDAKETFQFITLLPPPVRFLFRPIDRLISSICLPLLRKIVLALNRSENTTLLMDSNPRPASASTFSLGSYTIQVNTNSDPASLTPTPVPSSFSPLGGASPSPISHASNGNTASSEAQGYAIASVTGLSDPIADRRREKALKALDKRLSSMRQKLKGTSVAPMIPITPPNTASPSSLYSSGHAPDTSSVQQDSVALSMPPEESRASPQTTDSASHPLKDPIDSASGGHTQGDGQIRSREVERSQTHPDAQHEVNISVSPSSPGIPVHLAGGLSNEPSSGLPFDSHKDE